MTERQCPLCAGDARRLPPLPAHGGKEVRGIDCERCGGYYLTEEAERELGAPEQSPRRAMVSWVTRERSEQESPITLCSSSYKPSGEPDGIRIDEVLSTLVPRSVPERVDRALANLARRSRHPGDPIVVDAGKDWPLLFAENREALDFTLRHMVRSGLLDEFSSNDQGGGQYALTVRGWERVEELGRLRPQSRQGFVAMWFDQRLTEAWERGLRAAIEAAGYDPMRVDLAQFNERVDDRIIAEIRRSRFLVADVTGHRPAVYFEAGLAMGLGLPMIFTCHKDDLDKCNFDTRQYNHIVWESPEELKDKLKNRIDATIV